jgi:hypothetical protein
MLNELTPKLEERVAPTDCRLRPDQHSLELGQYDQVQYSGSTVRCAGLLGILGGLPSS